MFTVDDPARCAAELVRVCRPGGLLVSTAWAADSSLATPVAVALEQHPSLQDPSRPAPWSWTDGAYVAALFDGHDVEVRLERRLWWFCYPSTSAAFDFLERTSGPVRRLRAGVDAVDGDWSAVRDEVIARWDTAPRPADDGGIELPDPYAVLSVRRAS